MNIREHAREIRLELERLEQEYATGFLHVTTLANRDKNTVAGIVSEVNLTIASAGLVEGTLRRSTPEEIENLHERHAATRQLLQRQQAALAPKPLSVSVDRR
jgi:hypothetical protein